MPGSPTRVADVLAGYRGPVAPMSFDPGQLMQLRQKAPRLVRGIIAAKYRPTSILGSDAGMGAARHGLSAAPALTARPQFVAYAVGGSAGAAADLRAARFVHAAVDLGGAHRGRAASAARFADQMIFEGFRP